MEFTSWAKTKEIGILAEVSKAMGLLDVEAVLEVPVEGLGVRPPRVDAPEVRIPWRDRPQVLSPVEAPCLLLSGVCNRTVISRVAYSLGISY